MQGLPSMCLGVIVSFFLMFFVLDITAQTVDICGRTPQVRDKILSAIPNQSECATVTADQLSEIKSLDIQNTGIESIENDDFAGLSGLNVLQLEGHPSIDLPEDIFYHLSSLKRLGLADNGLNELPKNLFVGLSSLESIDLSKNSLDELPEGIFARFDSLKQLYLDRNSLKELREDVFADLSNLKRLDLFDNSLETLHENIFADLSSLKELFLHRNSLTTLPENIFDGILTESPLTVSVNGNPIKCLPQKILDLSGTGKIRLNTYPDPYPVSCEDLKPIVTLNLDPSTIMESGEITTVTASLNDVLSEDTTIDISVAPVSPADYTLSSNITLTIEAGETKSKGLVTIMALDNRIDGPDKRVIVRGQMMNAQGVENPEYVFLTILDDDTAQEVTLSVAPPEVNEGVGSAQVTVTATLDIARGTNTRVAISLEDETAIAGTDFVAVPSFTFLIPAKEIEGTGTFTFTPIPDELDEPDETVLVTGTIRVGRLQVSPATLTLSDVDTTPEVTLILTPTEISEAGGHTLITASLSSASTVETVIEVSAFPDSPATTGDYTLSSNQTLRIESGEMTSTGTVTITAVDNDVDAPNKTVTVRGQVTNRQDVTGPSDMTLTILNDDEAAGVTLDLDPFELNEDAGNTEVTVTAMLDTPSSEDTEVTVSVSDGSAVAGTDYEAVSPIDLTIPANGTVGIATFDLMPLDDLIHEPAETILITGESPALGSGKIGTYLTILDNDDLITLAIQNLTVSEDAGTASVPIEITPAAPFDLNLQVQTIGLTATEQIDYTLPQDLLQIPAGNRTAVLEMEIIDDQLFEGEETFQIRLMETAGVMLDPGEATVTIEDNDVYRLRVEDASALESEQELTFVVTLDPPNPVQTVHVAFETVAETAMESLDYMHQRGVLEFPPDTPRREVSVPIIDDTEEEIEETFFLQLSAPKHAELVDAKATGTIRDDDALPIVNIEGLVTVSEDAGEARFAVTLSRTLPGRDTEVEFSVTDETANASLDYQVQTQSPLRFISGETRKYIEIQILDDEIHEEEETFRVQLRGAQNGVLGEFEAQGVIVDNEDPVMVRIRDVEVTESAPEAVFAVELSGQDSKPRTFTYTTEDGSAVAGDDYEAVTGEITFEPGELLQEIRVPIIDDLETEPTETFRVRLSGDGLSDGEAQGTIQDDDAPLTVSIHDESASEGAGSLLLPVRLNRVSSQLVTVQFASSDETANAESDYVASRGIVIFERGSTEGKIRIQVLEDSEVESEETFHVMLSNARHATIAQGTGTGTILDNDGNPGVSVQGVTVSSRAATFDVRLSIPSTLLVLVSYASEDGSAQAGKDYEPVAGQVIFVPGELSKTIEVKLLSDEPVWEAKTFSLVLLSAMNAEIHEARTEAVMEEESEESIQNAYVSRVLRTWASQVVEALSRRMEGLAQCRVPDPSWLRYGTERRSLGQIFSGCGAEYTQGGWSVWGQGAFTRMRGSDGALSLRSDVTTLLVGADYAWSQGWMAGLLAAQSWDQGEYETPTRSGTASSQLTGIYPYVSYQTGAGMRAWMLLGLGRGETEVEALESEMDAALVALGLTGTLTGSTTGRLGYEVDAFWATADMETGSDLGVRRVRAGVEGSLQVGPSMQPYMEAALRQDGGDAETGMGIELGGGVRWSTSQLRAELGGRTLVLHTDEGLREWGLMGAIEYGTPGGLGPSMRVRPLWGNVYGGELWREAPIHSMVLGSTDQRVEMELGYGTPIKKSLGRSVVGMTLDPSGRAYRVGYNLRMSQGSQFSVATTARTMEANGTPYSYGITARMDLKW